MISEFDDRSSNEIQGIDDEVAMTVEEDAKGHEWNYDFILNFERFRLRSKPRPIIGVVMEVPA